MVTPVIAMVAGDTDVPSKCATVSITTNQYRAGVREAMASPTRRADRLSCAARGAVSREVIVAVVRDRMVVLKLDLSRNPILDSPARCGQIENPDTNQLKYEAKQHR